MGRISKRLNKVSPSPTLAVSAKATEMKARGLNIVDLSTGEPDFSTSEIASLAGIKAIVEGNTKYTLNSGTLELREAISFRTFQDTGVLYGIDEIIVSNGAKQSLFLALMAILDEEDQVLIPAPYWVSYTEMVKIVGGDPIEVPTTYEDDFKISVELLDKYKTENTKALLLNYPSNPSGITYSREILEEITKWSLENNIYIISDEIYSKLLYEGTHTSMPTVVGDNRDYLIYVNGVSKAYAMTGWRIGYVCGPKDVVKAMASLQSHMTSGPSSISQGAAAAALKAEQTYVEFMRVGYKKRRDFLYEKINNIKGLHCKNPLGAFYIFIDCREYIGRELEGIKIDSSVDFAEYLLEKTHVAVVPGEGFGMEGFIRITFATSDENLSEAVKRIEEVLN